MQRLLLITNDYFPLLGGVASYYTNLVKELSFNVAVLTDVMADSQEQLVVRKNFYWSLWPHWLPLLWLVPRYLKKLQAEIIWVGQLLPVGTAALILNLFFCHKYVISCHGLDLNLAARSVWKRWLSSKIIGHAALITVNSEFTRGLLKQFKVKLPPVTVVYPSLSPLPQADPALIASLRQKYDLSGKQVILTVARLVKRKGVNRVLQVLPKIQNRFKNIVYVVVGDGPERENLESGINNLGVPVKLVGGVSVEELSAWYNLADIFVLTPVADAADIEGFGMVYLEAASFSLPIVASAVGGVPEAVGKSGRYANSEVELQLALEKLLSDHGLRQRLGEELQQRTSKLFLPGQIAQILSAALANI